LPVWALENHDVRRAVSRYGAADAHLPESWTGSNMLYHDVPIDLALGTRRARAALALVLALPGSVYLYQGQELGLPEVLDLPDDARQDPAFLNGGQLGRDGCRVPLPWTAGPGGSHGFSPRGTAAPWLPQPPGWGEYAVARQEREPDSMLRLATDLLRTRDRLIEQGPAVTFVLTDRDDTVAFERGAALVITNAGRDTLDVPGALLAGRHLIACTDGSWSSPDRVPPDATAWWIGPS
jgi:alpha-glucosidase